MPLPEWHEHRTHVHPQGPHACVERVVVSMSVPDTRGAVGTGEPTEPVDLSPAASLRLVMLSTLSIDVVRLKHATQR